MPRSTSGFTFRSIDSSTSRVTDVIRNSCPLEAPKSPVQITHSFPLASSTEPAGPEANSICFTRELSLDLSQPESLTLQNYDSTRTNISRKQKVFGAFIRFDFFYYGIVLQIHYQYIRINQGVPPVFIRAPNTDVGFVSDHLHIPRLVQITGFNCPQTFKCIAVYNFHLVISINNHISFVSAEGDRLYNIPRKSSTFIPENILFNASGSRINDTLVFRLLNQTLPRWH